MLLLRLTRGISSGCHHATPKPIFLIVIVGRGIMLLLRLRQGISLGRLHATPYIPKFSELSLLWEGALCFCLDLAKVFLQDATMPPLHPIFSSQLSLWEGALCFCFDLAKVFIQGATLPPLHPKIFLNCHYCGKGALCFCFDLAKVFLQGATMPPLHHFFGIVIMVEG